MRYLHYVEDHAQKKFGEAEKAELTEIAGFQSGDKVESK
jgi:hypothetical protein